MNRENVITLKIRETSLVALILAVGFLTIAIMACVVGGVSNYIDSRERAIKGYDVWKTHEYYSWMYDYCQNCGSRLKVVQEKKGD